MKALLSLCVCAALFAPCIAQTPPTPPTPPSQPPPAPPTRSFGPRMPGQFRGAPRPMHQPYDASKEETIKAKVLEVKELSRGPMGTIVALLIETGGKEAQIALGPTEFLKEKKISFAKDDEITIKGYGYVRQAPPTDKAPPPEKGKEDGKELKAPMPPKPPDAPKTMKETPRRPQIGKGDEAAQPPRTSDAERQKVRIRAREVIKGEQSLVILNNDGRFVWAPDRPDRQESPGNQENTESKSE